MENRKILHQYLNSQKYQWILKARAFIWGFSSDLNWMLENDMKILKYFCFSIKMYHNNKISVSDFRYHLTWSTELTASQCRWSGFPTINRWRKHLQNNPNVSVSPEILLDSLQTKVHRESSDTVFQKGVKIKLKIHIQTQKGKYTEWYYLLTLLRNNGYILFSKPSHLHEKV